MFRGQKKPMPKSPAMGRQETAVWLGRALSSDQVALEAMLQLVHIIGVQQQALQALARQSAGQMTESEQASILKGAGNETSSDIFHRLEELETALQPVLQAVKQACASLEKEL